jgi:hypothetical protein
VIRGRAASVLGKLNPLLRPGGPRDVRPGISIAFAFTSIPAYKVTELGLTPEIPDHRVLAGVLAARETSPDTRLVFLARDTTPQLLAAHLGIEVIEIPEAYILKAELDPAERELRDLQREHARLQNARPKLTVSFVGGLTHFEHEFAALLPLTDDRMNELVEEAENWIDQHSEPITEPNVTALGKYAPEVLQAYEQAQAAYDQDVREYVTSLHRWGERLARRLDLKLVIANAGVVPATDISLVLAFPIGVTIEPQDHALEPPPPPRRPTGPSLGLAVGRALSASRGSYSAAFREPHGSRAMNPFFSLRIDDERSDAVRVEYTWRKLQQADTAELDPIFVVLPDGEVRSFAIPYELRADSMDPVRGSLHVVVSG